MALNGDTLGTVIKNAIKAWNPNPMTPAIENMLEEGWQTVANEITDHIKTYLDAVEVNFDKTIKNVLSSVDVQGAIDENSFGRCPIGTILDWDKDLSGVPALPSNWVECNGQTLSDAESLLNGQVIPNLNGDSGGADLNDGVNDNLGKTGEVFLKSDTVSGKTEVDRFQGHKHPYHATFSPQAFSWSGTFANWWRNTGSIPQTGDPITDGINGIPRTGLDTKPRSYSVVKIMRIK